ncbi:MAG: hypothetical protein R2747_16445 [Pyrinomonadaceae bacterium]
MNGSIKITLLFSGLFLLTGMIVGILKYRGMISSETHRAPVYIDIAHRASLLYSFAALVMAKLLEYSPFPPGWQIVIALVPLAYFALTITEYINLGLKRQEVTMFSRRTFITTWFMYSLIAGEIGGMALIVGGFLFTQFLHYPV